MEKLKEHPKKSLKSKIAFNIGAIILEDIPKYNPMVHFFDVKKSCIKHKIKITVNNKEIELPKEILDQIKKFLNK